MAAAVSSLIWAYLLGGVTLLPLLLLSVLLHAYLTLPVATEQSSTTRTLQDEIPGLQDETLKEKLLQSSHEPEAAAGYFAVCREYVPGGVNGKPPERTTPAGETIATESPSVYQSIYRSVFERGKTQTPTIEAGKPTKRARNVFYVVLRHGHLVLFDNVDQLEVRHVISLANYDVDIYAGGEDMPEGELYIKRNCLRLSQKTNDGEREFAPKPFYLFSENCSAKEDMYFAILYNQNKAGPAVETIESDDMINLIRQVHRTDSAQPHRWFNTLIGRIFLGIYKTQHLESLIRAKMNKKIARVPKPAFITSLQLGDLDMGHSAPIFSNMKLRECTVDGDITIEIDVRYAGHMRLVVAAVARIELGSRLKAREVDMVLATTLKSLEGHVLVRIKPPPSNRLWFSFETMPKMDLSVEPILSSRQITYSIITRAIESRLKEVLAETLVSPFWDDIPFHDTEGEAHRGGIWKREKASDITAVAEDGQKLLSKARLAPSLPGADLLGSADDINPPVRAASMPPDTRHDSAEGSDSGQSGSNRESKSLTKDNASDPPLATKKRHDAPKALRASSYTTAAIPVVNSNAARVSSPQNSLRRRHQQDGTSALKSLSAHSPESSPVGSLESPSTLDGFFSTKNRSNSLETPASPSPSHRRSSSGPSNSYRSLGTKSVGSSTLDSSSGDSSSAARPVVMPLSTELTGLDEANEADADDEARKAPVALADGSRKATINQTIATARNWGLGMIQRQMESRTDKVSPLAAKTLRIPQEPMGRGQPLPPPGMPLPKPKPDTWSAMAMNSLRRKPVASGPGSHLRKESLGSVSDLNTDDLSTAPTNGHSRQGSISSDAFGSHSRKASRTSDILASEPIIDEELSSAASHGVSSASRLVAVDNGIVPSVPEKDVDNSFVESPASIESSSNHLKSSAKDAAASVLVASQRESRAASQSSLSAVQTAAEASPQPAEEEKALSVPSPPAPTLARDNSSSSL